MKTSKKLFSKFLLVTFYMLIVIGYSQCGYAYYVFHVEDKNEKIASVYIFDDTTSSELEEITEQLKGKTLTEIHLISNYINIDKLIIRELSQKLSPTGYVVFYLADAYGTDVKPALSKAALSNIRNFIETIDSINIQRVQVIINGSPCDLQGLCCGMRIFMGGC